MRDAKKQRYNPPYRHIFVVHLDAECMKEINYDERELDRFDAITIHEDDLPAFNNCIKFVQ